MTPRTGPRGRGDRETTFDVRLWSIRRVAGKKRTTYDVRWVVNGRNRSRAFTSRALAESFRSELRAAVNRGEAFDVATGLPIGQVPREAQVSWWDWSLTFVDLKWEHLAPRSRRSLAEALTTATMALVETGATSPPARQLRAAMLQWAYNSNRRGADGDPPQEFAAAIGWLSRHTPPLVVLEDPKQMRALLVALGKKLDGTQVSATVAARKRAVVHNALEFAVEHGHFATNPAGRIKRTTPKAAERIDPRTVVNPEQARRLLDAVAQVEGGARLKAFFALIYYAALRPSEALQIAESDLVLPDADNAFGEIRVGLSNPEVTGAWTDHGVRRPRQLKHRARNEVRPVPAAPQLVAILEEHLQSWSIQPGGLLFRGPRGGHLSEDRYSSIWQQARRLALSPTEAVGPLAARPYDLRHAAVSTWLAAGIDSAQVAAWAGHSVAVLHRVYAHTLSGRDRSSLRRLVAAFRDVQPGD